MKKYQKINIKFVNLLGTKNKIIKDKNNCFIRKKKDFFLLGTNMKFGYLVRMTNLF